MTARKHTPPLCIHETHTHTHAHTGHSIVTLFFRSVSLTRTQQNAKIPSRERKSHPLAIGAQLFPCRSPKRRISREIPLRRRIEKNGGQDAESAYLRRERRLPRTVRTETAKDDLEETRESQQESRRCRGGETRQVRHVPNTTDSSRTGRAREHLEETRS